MKYIYFDSDRLSLLVEWLRKYPADHYGVLIGTNIDQDIYSVFSFVILTDLQLGLWLTEKMVNGEIRLMIFRKLDLPEGVELDRSFLVATLEPRLCLFYFIERSEGSTI